MNEELSKLELISIKDIDLDRIIFSLCGDHNQDSLNKTIKKKLADIQNLGYCLWAHGNLNPDHTRKFCEERKQKDIYVFMPVTLSNSTSGSEGKPFIEWNDGKENHKIPHKMYEVTGSERSNRAFYFEKIFKLKEKVNFRKILQYYDAINNSEIRPRNKADETLKGQCSNKCLEIREPEYIQNILKEFNKNDGKNIILIGKLHKPYHVSLIRSNEKGKAV